MSGLEKLARESKAIHNYLENHEDDAMDDPDHYIDDLPNYYQGEDGELIFES